MRAQECFLRSRHPGWAPGQDAHAAVASSPPSEYTGPRLQAGQQESTQSPRPYHSDRAHVLPVYPERGVRNTPSAARRSTVRPQYRSIRSFCRPPRHTLAAGHVQVEPPLHLNRSPMGDADLDGLPAAVLPSFPAPPSLATIAPEVARRQCAWAGASRLYALPGRFPSSASAISFLVLTYLLGTRSCADTLPLALSQLPSTVLPVCCLPAETFDDDGHLSASDLAELLITRFSAPFPHEHIRTWSVANKTAQPL
ncbi:hypothetical protein C8R47DRAFT_618083 [Mycena vitilis]|nr:hypothetical protein C8R47DRAFT_618083 [Mycena vitilis]